MEIYYFSGLWQQLDDYLQDLVRIFQCHFNQWQPTDKLPLSLRQRFPKYCVFCSNKESDFVSRINSNGARISAAKASVTQMEQKRYFIVSINVFLVAASRS